LTRLDPELYERSTIGGHDANARPGTFPHHPTLGCAHPACRARLTEQAPAMTGAAAAVALAGTFAVLVALVFLHVAPTGLSPVRDPVSAYALTPYRAAYAIAAYGAMVSAGATALLLSRVTPTPLIAVALLGIFAIARGLIPLFPMDAPEALHSRTGRVHTALAVTAFATVTASAFLASGTLAAAGANQLAAISTWAGILMGLGSAIVIAGSASARVRAVFGLGERLIYLGFIAWFAAIAVTALVTM
jgi:hypothetical protein